MEEARLSGARPSPAVSSIDVKVAEGTLPGEQRPATAAPFLLRIQAIKKRYGHTQALDGVDLSVRPSEIVGVVGHNGAGKSTLMKVITGLTRPDSGSIQIQGWDGDGTYDLAQARRLGVRIAFQELSLCPTLKVFENVVVAHRALAGRGWRRRTQVVIRQQLDSIFSHHHVSPRARIGSLSLAQRQMVEVAQASLATDQQPRLLILDEPTSALSEESANNLFRYVREAVAGGLSCILISHRIAEVLRNVDRVIVMRNGQIVAERPAVELTEDEVIALMGTTTVRAAHVQREAVADTVKPIVEVTHLSTNLLRDVEVRARPGEIVGLAGLDGQGQRELLLALWKPRGRQGRRAVHVKGRLAFVTGDRQAAGLFPLWPVVRNVSISALYRIGSNGLLSLRRERSLAAHWIERLAIKGTLATPVPDLSGGTQQKVLVARALAVGADVVLLDDPFRGVDIGTKREIYRLLREEAEHGRCFIWFTTENLELKECDRAYVLHGGSVVCELSGAEITEERIIAASFGGT